MDESEFDRFADEYREVHARNIRLSGESPEYFAEYKIADAARFVRPPIDGRPLHILDFGAGVGTSVPHFLRYFPGCSLHCLDVSRKSLQVGLERFGGLATFTHFDGRAIPYERDQFDLVFLACVLHHIPHGEHEGILGELHRVVRPGGILIVFEHNPYNPLSVHAVNTCPFDENAVLIRPRRIRAALDRVGFRRPSVQFRIFFPHALRHLRGLERWMTGIPLGAQYSVHGRKM